MFKVLIVGCGDLGGAVACQLAQSGIEVVGVRRSAQPLDGVHVIAADVTQPASLAKLKQVQPDVLVYCVAANGQTDEQYKAQYVDGLRNVLTTQSENPKLKHVFFVSSTRVYGQKTEALLDESIAAIPADFGGERLLETERILSALPCTSTVLRLSGIYGPGRLRMINLAKSPESWPVQNSWTNRIHRDDAAAFMVFLIQQVFAGKAVLDCYIVTDSKPASQHEVLGWVAGKLHINTDANTQVPIEGGKRLSNRAMLATGFKLQYPDYQAGYSALIKALVSSTSSTQQRG